MTYTVIIVSNDFHGDNCGIVTGDNCVGETKGYNCVDGANRVKTFTGDNITT